MICISSFGQLPFFSYFCTRYDNTERLLQYDIFYMDDLRTIDISDDALYSFSYNIIPSEHHTYVPYGILDFLLQSTVTQNCFWR